MLNVHMDVKLIYKNVEILKFVNKFKELMNTGESTTEDSLSLGLDYLANTRHASDSLADIFFTDTEISYRDDNRVMWIFIEDDQKVIYFHLVKELHCP